jgi:hypothetical protein
MAMLIVIGIRNRIMKLSEICAQRRKTDTPSRRKHKKEKAWALNHSRTLLVLTTSSNNWPIIKINEIILYRLAGRAKPGQAYHFF